MLEKHITPQECISGWLLDVYAADEQGIVLWLLGEDGKRRRFHQKFPHTFYAHGPFPRLRSLWQYLREQPGMSLRAPTFIRLSRTQREDLFSGVLDVLAVEVENVALLPQLFRQVSGAFPDLHYYNADIPLSLLYCAATNVFPFAFCRVVSDEDGRIHEIAALDSRWEMEPALPSLRILHISPDTDPSHTPPKFLHIRFEQAYYRLSLVPVRPLLIGLTAILQRHDPDLILTDWGDTWLFPYLLELSKKRQIPFNPNRDQNKEVEQRRERSYYTYGQVVYRGQQTHLFGRWHIDRRNAMMYGDYGLDGVFEQARVTGLPVQEIARKSPGAGITAIQMQTALQKSILIPYQKQQAERPKTALGLIHADRGGLVFQPIIGVHRHVAEVDFVSMYPSVMVYFNISPETVGGQLDERGERTPPGLVPLTLRPLLAKRIEIKSALATLSRLDCRYGPLEARANALKWLLVVCFGYLGYKNARFGRIESHEAVTAYGRETLLRAKETAEDMDFRVLHMYVDGLWVQRPGSQAVADFQPLLDEIVTQTKLPTALEGVYRWVKFLPSRMDDRVPVANRYFGLFQDGRVKVRGIEARRHDTPPFIAQTQMDILREMGHLPDDRPLSDCIPHVRQMLRERVRAIRAGKVKLEDLLSTQTLTRTLDAYRVKSPVARAATQLEEAGKPTRPGQRVRFLFTRGAPRVYAWDLPTPPDPAMLDIPYYGELLLRAANTVLWPEEIETLHSSQGKLL